MKNLWKVAAVLIVLAFVFACAGGPKEKEARPTGEIKVEPQLYPPKVIEHKNTAFGGDVPDWVFWEQADLEQQSEYKDVYVFKFDQEGKDLEGLKAWTRSFVAATEVARMVSTRVLDKFVGAQVGDKDMVETYMEEVAKVLSVAEYAGARKKADFWVYRQFYDDNGKPTEKRYMYLLLYTVPRDQIDAAIQRALDQQDKASKPKTEEEQTARDRVKELFGSGL
jgi:hypothetical protein